MRHSNGWYFLCVNGDNSKQTNKINNENDWLSNEWEKYNNKKQEKNPIEFQVDFEQEPTSVEKVQ